jgi:hypothetical protein
VPRLLKNETDAYDHSSLSLSSLLKNETNPPPSESSLPLDQVIEPSFPPRTENIPICSQMPRQRRRVVRGKNAWGGRSPASVHHVGVKPLAFIMQYRGNLPLERHIARSDPRLGVIPIIT